jgi:hypothetical protein
VGDAAVLKPQLDKLGKVVEVDNEGKVIEEEEAPTASARQSGSGAVDLCRIEGGLVAELAAFQFKPSAWWVIKYNVYSM